MTVGVDIGPAVTWGAPAVGPSWRIRKGVSPMRLLTLLVLTVLFPTSAALCGIRNGRVRVGLSAVPSGHTSRRSDRRRCQSQNGAQCLER